MRICVISYGFNESNIRLQPWNYIFRMSRELNRRGHEIIIISDNFNKNLTEKYGIKFCYIEKLTISPITINLKLIQILISIDPDIIISSVGVTSFGLLKTLERIDKPKVGLWTSSIYGSSQILNLGIKDLYYNFISLKNFFIISCIPIFLIKSMLKPFKLTTIIALNTNTLSQLASLGINVTNLACIPPGMDRMHIENTYCQKSTYSNFFETFKDYFILIYLGSPLSLRGIDTLIESVSRARIRLSNIKLVILSRASDDYLKLKEIKMKCLCRKRGITDITYIVSGFIDENDVKLFLYHSDIVIMPFKLVPSDNPLAILEAMAIGKPIISTRVDGIPEMLANDRGILVEPNNPRQLEEAITKLYYDERLREKIGANARNYMKDYPNWDQIGEKIETLLLSIT